MAADIRVTFFGSDPTLRGAGSPVLDRGLESDRVQARQMRVQADSGQLADALCSLARELERRGACDDLVIKVNVHRRPTVASFGRSSVPSQPGFTLEDSAA